MSATTTPDPKRHLRPVFLLLDLDDGVLLVVPAGPLREPEESTGDPHRAQWEHVPDRFPVTGHDGDVEPERLERTVAVADKPARAVRDQRASPEPRVVVEPVSGIVLLGDFEIVDAGR